VVGPSPGPATGSLPLDGPPDGASLVGPPPLDPETARSVTPRQPRRPAPSTPRKAHRKRRLRLAGTAAILLGVLALLGTGAYVASQSVYFIGTDNRGLVTMFNGFPYELPGGVKLYSEYFVSGVSASTLSAQRRRTLLDHSLRSEENATELVRSLELGQLE
jgi:PPM family protein phosphatase